MTTYHRIALVITALIGMANLAIVVALAVYGAREERG